MNRKKSLVRSNRKGKGKALPLPTSGDENENEVEDGDKGESLDEQWDVYYHAFRLHSASHSQCFWYKSQNSRNEETLHMFVAARWPPIE
ncbi:hypothetical protein L204_102731 [Cryptococcus depauperatus]